MSHRNFATALACACTSDGDYSRDIVDVVLSEADDWMKKFQPKANAEESAKFRQGIATLVANVCNDQDFDATKIQTHMKHAPAVVATLQELRKGDLDQISAASQVSSSLTGRIAAAHHHDDVDELSQDFESAVQISADVSFREKFGSLFSSREKNRLKEMEATMVSNRNEVLDAARKWMAGILDDEGLSKEVRFATTHEIDRLRYMFEKGGFLKLTNSARSSLLKSSGLTTGKDSLLVQARDLQKSLPAGLLAWDPERKALTVFVDAIRTVAALHGRAGRGDDLKDLNKGMADVTKKWTDALNNLRETRQTSQASLSNGITSDASLNRRREDRSIRPTSQASLSNGIASDASSLNDRWKDRSIAGSWEKNPTREPMLSSDMWEEIPTRVGDSLMSSDTWEKIPTEQEKVPTQTDRKWYETEDPVVTEDGATLYTESFADSAATATTLETAPPSDVAEENDEKGPTYLDE